MVRNELLEEMCGLYSEISGECLHDDTPIQEYQKEWTPQILQACIALYLKRADDMDDAAEKVKGIIDRQPHHEDIRQMISVDKAYREAKIRRDFEGALQSVTDGAVLSGALGYGFSHEDLTNLAFLHKNNRFRNKIEDLLTDCNFHEECEMMHSGNYSAWLDD